MYMQVDYQHNEGFCGGFSHQFSPAIGGRCGICGDAWDASPREHEAPGGRFANGLIVRTYQPGEEIQVTVKVTANHKGYFTFRLCRNNDIQQDPDQSCFEGAGGLLQVAPSGDYRFPVSTAMGNGAIEVSLRLPQWECDQCILQWTYTAGNSWGVCSDGSGGVGCGPQEHFRACADIRVSGSTIVLPTLPTVPPPALTTPPPPVTSGPGATPAPPAPGTGQTCVAVGPWAGDTSMASWCLDNCFAPSPYCPQDRCDCVDSPPPQSTSVCQATGAWSGSPGMDSWCVTNCNHAIPYCPPAHCSCDAAPTANTTETTETTETAETGQTAATTAPGSQPSTNPLQVLLAMIYQLLLLFLSLFFPYTHTTP